jgi:hypothetical protein
MITRQGSHPSGAGMRRGGNSGLIALQETLARLSAIICPKHRFRRYYWENILFHGQKTRFFSDKSLPSRQRSLMSMAVIS